MRAALYEEFGKPLRIEEVPDPTPSAHGVVIEVKATGLCRSDWHGWMGHDGDIKTLPHVPGHELAGVVAAVGKQVRNWRVGDRVTTPFVCGCGTCPQCVSGNHQVCDHQTQPGFTHWGSFAEYVAIHHADTNLVRLPEALSYEAAASLGCRFVTSFRAVVDQGQVSAGQWVAVHGCGGVGLSAVMIAAAVGANVVAVDISDEQLALAQSVGALAVVNARQVEDAAAAVIEITRGGAHVSLDALGSQQTCYNSIMNLRKRGKHIQVGILSPEKRDAPVPIGKIMAHELEIIGSHGMQAYRYDAMLDMLHAGKLSPERLIGQTITLEQSLEALARMNEFANAGVTIINQF